MSELLTPDEVCTQLKVSRSWLQSRVQSGELEPIRLGYRTYRFTQDSITALVQRLNEKGEAI